MIGLAESQPSVESGRWRKQLLEAMSVCCFRLFVGSSGYSMRRHGALFRDPSSHVCSGSFPSSASKSLIE